MNFFKKNILSLIKLKNIKIMMFLDFILLPLALFTAIMLRLGANWDHRLDSDIWIFLSLPLWTIPVFMKFGLYKSIIEYFDEKIVVIIFLGVSISVLILVSVMYLFHIYSLPKTAIIIFWVIALAYIGGTRFIMKGILSKFNFIPKKNIVIYGAGSAGLQLCMTLKNNPEYNPVFFIDDDYKKTNKIIKGLKVIHPSTLDNVIKQSNIESILVAMPSIKKSRQREIINSLERLSLSIKVLPSIGDLIKGEVTVSNVKEVEIEDLLGRDTIEPDFNLMSKNIFNKVVLITGGGGSIGSELVRQVLLYGPNKLIILDHSEFAIYSIEKKIQCHKQNAIFILGSVTDEQLMHNLFQQYKINTIYHAAAYKHVPIVESNQINGIYNNSIGTYIIAKLAMKYNVDIMVLISTDKAVRPTNIMGASKRLAEMIMQAFNHDSTYTKFTLVRFGNVLGSSGSVVPIFKEQIKSGGPVTVTHPNVIRYFMTTTEAVELVIQSSSMSKGGEVFILDMGSPVKIIDLAHKMIHLSGYTIKDEINPSGDIEIKFTGLRAGEKLYEELLIKDNPIDTTHSRIKMANENFIPLNELNLKLTLLISEIDKYNVSEVLKIIKNLVSECGDN